MGLVVPGSGPGGRWFKSIRPDVAAAVKASHLELQRLQQLSELTRRLASGIELQRASYRECGRHRSGKKDQNRGRDVSSRPRLPSSSDQLENLDWRTLASAQNRTRRPGVSLTAPAIDPNTRAMACQLLRQAKAAALRPFCNPRSRTRQNKRQTNIQPVVI
jgi:hypothetical protein